MEKFATILEAAEYEHFGVRAHRTDATVGVSLGNSKVWIDGVVTDDELNGISTIKVKTTTDLEAVVSRLQREYCWSDERIVLVGGNTGEWGEDAGEYIISDNVCLAVL